MLNPSVAHTGSGPRLTLVEKPDPPMAVIACPRHGCGYSASASNEGLAIRALASHLVSAHMAPPEGK